MYAIQKPDETLVTEDGETLTFVYEDEAEKANFMLGIDGEVVEFQYLVRSEA